VTLQRIAQGVTENCILPAQLYGFAKCTSRPLKIVLLFVRNPQIIMHCCIIGAYPKSAAPKRSGLLVLTVTPSKTEKKRGQMLKAAGLTLHAVEADGDPPSVYCFRQ